MKATQYIYIQRCIDNLLQTVKLILNEKIRHIKVYSQL